TSDGETAMDLHVQLARGALCHAEVRNLRNQLQRAAVCNQGVGTASSIDGSSGISLRGNQQDVGRLEVAMDNPVSVRYLNGPRQHFDKLWCQVRRLRRAMKVLGQATAGEVLQDKIGSTVNVADIVNLHDIGMLQPRNDVGLGPKSGQRLVVGARPI